MRLIQLAALLLLSVTSIKMTESCEIASNTLTAHGRVIEVSCGPPGMDFSLQLEDEDELSSLEVFGKRMGEEFKRFLSLKVEHNGKSNSMSLTLNDKRLKDRDESTDDELATLEDLLKNPYFTNFPAVARLIHDELQLPGRESRSVMMLYRIGRFLHDHHSSRKRRAPREGETEREGESELQRQRDSEWQKQKDRTIRRKEFELDFMKLLEGERHAQNLSILSYHGNGSTEDCNERGGYSIQGAGELHDWFEDRCLGLCGKMCNCWWNVCEDCCIHKGCAEHDYICRSEGDDSLPCIKFKGVVKSEYELDDDTARSILNTSGIVGIFAHYFKKYIILGSELFEC